MHTKNPCFSFVCSTFGNSIIVAIKLLRYYFLFFILRMEALVFAYFIFWIVFIVILLIPNSSTFQPRSTEISVRFFSLSKERISLDTKSLKSKFQITFDMRFAFRERIIEPFKCKLDFLRYRLNRWTLSLVLISLKSIELIWAPFYLSLDRFRDKKKHRKQKSS